MKGNKELEQRSITSIGLPTHLDLGYIAIPNWTNISLCKMEMIEGEMSRDNMLAH